ncbi:MAG: pyridoxal 5'-phosphate synthase glutaminase subunit PdxT [Microthrixaceae bacterium]
MKVGVLALQGAFAAHVALVESLGAAALEVRTPEQLAESDRLIIPGGESTTMSMMIERSGLTGAIESHIAAGRPTFGTCAGAILLAERVENGRADQRCFGAIPMAVARNAFGRQRESFETELEVEGFDRPFHAVFIRAPRITEVDDSVEVLASVDGSPALVRHGSVMASTFHPELSGDRRIHEIFCSPAHAPEQ